MVEIIPTRTLIRERKEMLKARNDGSSYKDGRVNYMAHADGWVMVRRPGCIPYTVTMADWLALPVFAKEKS